MDVHVSAAIPEGLRLRGVDVLTAQEDGRRRLPDPELLDRATALGRVLFTQDDDLLREAAERQRISAARRPLESRLKRLDEKMAKLNERKSAIETYVMTSLYGFQAWKSHTANITPQADTKPSPCTTAATETEAAGGRRRRARGRWRMTSGWRRPSGQGRRRCS